LAAFDSEQTISFCLLAAMPNGDNLDMRSPKPAYSPQRFYASLLDCIVTSPTIIRPEAESTTESTSSSRKFDDRALIARWLLRAVVSVLIALCAAELIGRFIVSTASRRTVIILNLIPI